MFKTVPKTGICFLKRVTSTVMLCARKMALFDDDLGEEMHQELSRCAAKRKHWVMVKFKAN